MGRRWNYEIFLVSLAAIVLEISLTRIFSFKLFYHFTYVVLGLAMLGLGSGGVIVALLPPAWRRPEAVPGHCLLAALAVLLGFQVVTLLPVNALEAVEALPTGDTSLLWSEGAKLLVLCLAVYLPFLATGLAVSTILSTHAERVHSLYFFDLVGAGIGCGLAVPLLLALSPPGAVMLAGTLFALAGLPAARDVARRWVVPLVALGLVAMAGSLFAHRLPELVVDRMKTMGTPKDVVFSAWSAVLRIDVFELPGIPGGGRVISHDGMWGALLRPFDGDATKLTVYDGDARAYPFQIAESPDVAIIGAAGGNEVLASLHFGANHVTAIELNPITVSLLTDHFREYTGDLASHEQVTLVNAEGRSFLMNHDGVFDVVWFVTPDTYAAMNGASSGAQVMSESYLYTVEMMEEALARLSPDGIIVTQFGGEYSPEHLPRTTKILSTAREAFRRAGIEDFEKHVLVSSYSSFPLTGASIVLKKSPVTDDDIEAFTALTRQLKNGEVRFSPRTSPSDDAVDRVVRGQPDELDAWYAAFPYEVRPVTDDSPFFWHIVRFGKALGAPTSTPQVIHESGTGERLMVLLLITTTLLAALCLFVPLLARRRLWREVPGKTLAAVYFGALGLGFMYLEVSLMQRLTLFLGFPTYSLTVTLFAILLSTGIGSRLSERLPGATAPVVCGLAATLVVVTAFYAFGLPALVDAFIGAPLALRIALTIAFLIPLGLCLGVFMPLGLRTVSTLSSHGEEYVAWGWSINGFFSVVGSVSSGILAMNVGFTGVMWIAVAIYLVGLTALLRLAR